MLSRSHQAGVDRDIGVDLDAADSEPERLQELLSVLSEMASLP